MIIDIQRKRKIFTVIYSFCILYLVLISSFLSFIHNETYFFLYTKKFRYNRKKIYRMTEKRKRKVVIIMSTDGGSQV